MRNLRSPMPYFTRTGLSGVLGKARAIMRGAPLIPSALLVVFIVSGTLAPWISPRDPGVGTLRQSLDPPIFQKGGSSECFIGCDIQGRDILSRIIHGARVSLIVAFFAIAIAGGTGVTLGLAAGYFGGIVDALIMRLVDVWYALPSILLALILVVVLGPGLLNVILVIGITLWAFYARLIRAEVLTVRQLDYVALAKVAGSSGFRIALRHILPNVFNSVIIIATLQVGGVILFEASLSFLGLGVPVSVTSWGQMVADGRQYVTTAWWLAAWPGIAITLTVLCFNLFGDWLRDYLDPKLRQVETGSKVTGYLG